MWTLDRPKTRFDFYEFGRGRVHWGRELFMVLTNDARDLNISSEFIEIFTRAREGVWG